MFTNDPDDLGLLVEDEDGKVPIKQVNTCKDKASDLIITLARSLIGSASISYGWQANPTFTPIVDEITYLPVVSFYKHTIK